MAEQPDEEEEEWEEYPVPPDFHHTKWPQPRLDRRGRPTGSDEALAWFVQYFETIDGEDITTARVNRKKSYVRVKVKGLFRCHKCRHGWKSSHSWITFNMRDQTVTKM